MFDNVQNGEYYTWRWPPVRLANILETEPPNNLKLTLSASIVHSINHSEHSQASLTRLISSMAPWTPINGPNNVDISPAGQSGTLMQSYNFFLLFLHRMLFHKITNITLCSFTCFDISGVVKVWIGISSI